MINRSDDLLTTTEVSQMFKVNRVTVTQWVRAGKLKAIRTLGGYLRVPRENLIEFLNENQLPLPKDLEVEVPCILIAEDNEDAAGLLKKSVLERMPRTRVERADNGVSALIKVGDLKPQVLILDMVMPEMDGLEVIRRIKADPSYSRMVIMAVSAHAEKEGPALGAGADAFFLKQRGFADLLEALPAFLGAANRPR